MKKRNPKHGPTRYPTGDARAEFIRNHFQRDLERWEAEVSLEARAEECAGRMHPDLWTEGDEPFTAAVMTLEYCDELCALGMDVTALPAWEDFCWTVRLAPAYYEPALRFFTAPQSPDGEALSVNRHVRPLHRELVENRHGG
jgi:hypothetical protein